MSNNNTTTVQFGAYTFALGEYKFKNHRTVDNPDKPGKKRREEFDDVIITPPISTADEVKQLFCALVDEAESRSPGNGQKLAFTILKDRLLEGNDTLIEAAKANKDEATSLAEYRAELVTLSRAPSKGMSAADIAAKLAEYAIELAVIMPILMGTKQITEVVDGNGAQVYASVDEATLRFAALDRQIAQLQSVNAEREKKRAEARKVKEAKAAEAAKVAAAAAAAAAAGQVAVDTATVAS